MVASRLSNLNLLLREALEDGVPALLESPIVRRITKVYSHKPGILAIPVVLAMQVNGSKFVLPVKPIGNLV